MGIVVESGGLLTSVQDMGRFGYESYGLSPSGAMDPDALRLANVLVGNPQEEAGLEITAIGPRLLFTAPAYIAVTGADLSMTVNGRRANVCRAYKLNAGDTVSFGGIVSGYRAYLAVAGGFDIPEVLQSRSTLLRYKIGGLSGRKLTAGDFLPLRSESAELHYLGARRALYTPIPDGVRRIRVVLGPQDDMFSQDGLDTFLGTEYTVTVNSDRMGYRLAGPKLSHIVDGNIISDGIVMGSIQVPSSGEPILMMAEHATVGGYTKIATIISADFGIAAQCKPGDRLRFEAVSIEEAHRLLFEKRNSLFALERALSLKPVCETDFSGNLKSGCYYTYTCETESSERNCANVSN